MNINAGTYLFLLVVHVICLSLSVQDLHAQSGSGSVTVNIVFRPVQTISVSTDQRNIDITYATINDHLKGVSVERGDHLTVFSTGGFLVSVEASSEHFTRSGGTETIPASDLIIRATGNTENITASNFWEATLSTDPAPLITSQTGGRDLKYNVTYDNTVAGGNNQYLNHYMSEDVAESIYRSHITYTITTP